MKISILVFIGPSIFWNLLRVNPQAYPIGLCKWLDCSFLNNDTIKFGLAGLIAVLLIFYLFEKGMLWVTLLLFLFSLLIFTIEESNGVKGRRGLFTLIFLAQFLAYLFHQIKLDLNINKNRVQFCCQLIAAVYTLAALSKLSNSGLQWFVESPRIILQITKSYYFTYINTGTMDGAADGVKMADWIGRHNVLTLLLLGGSLLLEIFSFVLILNKKIAFIYAVLMLGMHIGTLITMDIFFPTVSFPLIIFFINPFFLGYTAVTDFKSANSI